MTDITASVFEDSCSISEFDSDELHRIHSSKNIRTLESLKRTNLKQEELSVDKIREFLHDTCTSAAFDALKNEEPLDAQKFEKIIYKQQFLEKMNLFNPTKYFSGIESTTFEDILLDRRLGEMFMEELPLEDDNDKENNLNSANGVRAESNKPNGKTKHKKTNSNLSKQQSMNQKAFKNFYQEHENPSKKHSGEHTSKMNWDAFHSKSNKNTPILNLGSKLNSGSKMNSGVKSKKIKTPMTQSFTQNEAGHFISNLPAGSPIRAKGLDLNDFHSKSKLTLNNGRESTKESSVKKSDTPTQTRRTRIGSPVVMNLQQNTQKETTATKFNHKKSPLNYNIQPHFDHQYKKASSFVENSCGEGASNRAGSNQTRTAHPSFIENLRNQSSEKSGDKVRKKLFSTKSNLNKETLSIKQTPAPAPAQKLNTCFDLADKPKTTTPSLYHLKMPKMQHYPGKKLKNNSGPGQRFATEL